MDEEVNQVALGEKLESWRTSEVRATAESSEFHSCTVRQFSGATTLPHLRVVLLVVSRSTFSHVEQVKGKPLLFILLYICDRLCPISKSDELIIQFCFRKREKSPCGQNSTKTLNPDILFSST